MDFHQIITNQKTVTTKQNSMKKHLLLFCILLYANAFSQSINDLELSFEEYISYVKQFHPIVKQANLKLEEGEYNLLKARGSFDPKIEANYDRKDFKNKDYYNLFNATFKVPTWYGVELKANFENNDGQYLNPQNNVPDDGLFSAGISASLGQGLIINERMATLKKAKYFIEQNKAERTLAVNKVLYDASIAYFEWLQAYNEQKMYSRFLENAKTRYNGVRKSVLAGDKPGIDSLEANININNRKLSLEQSSIKFLKNTLKVSNFLWLDSGIPIEINSSVTPAQLSENTVNQVLNLNQDIEFEIDNHPKLNALNNKIKSLDVDAKLKANKLLPKVDVQYNFITENPDISNSYSLNNYKLGLNVSFPLFLRKERGNLKLTKLKIDASKFERLNTGIAITNKVEALKKELDSYITQIELIDAVVKDYNTLLNAEERKFSFGESSVFLINYRESSLIDAELKALKLKNMFYKTKVKLFEALGNI